MKILAIGDIVGKPGRETIKALLPGLKKEFSLDFVIANGEYKGTPVNGLVGVDLTPKSRLAKWISKLLNREIEMDEEINAEELTGIPCRISVSLKDKE